MDSEKVEIKDETSLKILALRALLHTSAIPCKEAHFGRVRQPKEANNRGCTSQLRYRALYLGGFPGCRKQSLRSGPPRADILHLETLIVRFASAETTTFQRSSAVLPSTRMCHCPAFHSCVNPCERNRLPVFSMNCLPSTLMVDCRYSCIQAFKNCGGRRQTWAEERSNVEHWQVVQ